MLLEHHHGVFHEVVEGKAFAGFNDVLVLLDEEPADMREEEATGGIVRISISLYIYITHAKY